jgi:hypothetical protein
MDTPGTLVFEEPKNPPKFTAPVTVLAPLVEKFVSSTQNLRVIWLKFTAVVPVLITSKVWFAWLAWQVVNSFNCRLAKLVPQAAPVVGVGDMVFVGERVTVKVRVAVGLEVRVAVAVAVLWGVAVLVKVGVEEGEKEGVKVAVRDGVKVAVGVRVAVGVQVGVVVGE